MRARLYAARFVSAPAQPRGRGPPYPAPELFCSCRSAGQPRSCPRLVPCAGLWVWSPSRPRAAPRRRRRTRNPRAPHPARLHVRSASGRCADSDIIIFLSTRPTEHSMHLRSRTDAGLGARSAASGTRARTLQFSDEPQAIRSTAVRCPAPYAVVRVVSQMISMEPTRLRIAWLTSRFLRDAP
jgi:hypothetical protein